MENVTSLKKQYKALDEKWEDLRASVFDDPAVVAADKAHDKAIEEAEKRIQRQLDEMKKQMREIEEKISDAEEKKEVKIPKAVNVFVQRLYGGCDWGSPGWSIRWVSPKEQFVIATCAGHAYWSGRGESSYGAAKHHLFDISKLGQTFHGLKVIEVCEVFKVEGRLSKDKKQSWQEFAINIEK